MRNPINYAFSFVEIIIVISIITLLSIIWYSATQNMVDDKNNSAVLADLVIIDNALSSLVQTDELPIPKWNNNSFNKDGSYAHSFSDTDTFGVYGKITEETISKRFLDIAPLDPRTNQYYSYGVTKSLDEYEIAWIISDDNGNIIAKVDWNYTAENGPYNLIRSYNSPRFVIDKWVNLPYNPDEKIFSVTDENGLTYLKWDEIVTTTESLELYFSDWSVSVLEADSQIVLTETDFPTDTNLVSHIKLLLNAWTIWTKATKLDEDSYFEVYTSDATAAVRWTIFWVSKDDSDTEIVVIEWSIEVFNQTYSESIETINSWETIKIKDSVKESTSNNRININETPAFEESNVQVNVDLNIILAETATTSNDETIEDTSENNVTTDTGSTDEQSDNEEVISENIIDYDVIETCTIGDFTWILSDLICTVQENKITPWISKTVNLDWAFEIEIVVDFIPSTKQYLLYGWSEFKLFFYEGDICFQKYNYSLSCQYIWEDRKITISRNSSNDIILNWYNTNKNYIWKIDNFKIWYFPIGDNKILNMDTSNNININIKDF